MHDEPASLDEALCGDDMDVQGFTSVMTNFSQMSELAARECIPCKGGVPPLTREELTPLLAQLDPGWAIAERVDHKGREILFLVRTYDFPDFKSAMAFADDVADVAEEQQHHPDLHISWGRTRVEIWTHKIGGLTESDAVFAAKCDGLY